MSSQRFTVVPDCLQCSGEHEVEFQFFNWGDYVEPIDTSSNEDCNEWQRVFDTIFRRVQRHNNYKKRHTTIPYSLPTQDSMVLLSKERGLRLWDE